VAVTLYDVASEAGVSISTVSRTLSAPERVAPSTRARVRAAVEMLGYQPNRAASLLRSGRTGVIGMVVPDLENPYFAGIVKGVQARARLAGSVSLIVDSDEKPQEEVALVRLLIQQTDGIVLCAPRALDNDMSLLSRVPVVLVNQVWRDVPSITIDHSTGMLRAVEHLRALGHRALAYVGGPEHSRSDADRRDGLRRAQELYSDLTITSLGNFPPQVAGGEAAADLAAASGATGVLAFNDLVAIGLLRRLARRGLRVPEDISVVGTDDTLVAQLATPQLTTLHVDLAQLGKVAVELLLDLIARGPAAAPGSPSPAIREPLDLVVRASTGMAPASSASHTTS